jgi:hypothetical protein
VIVGEVESERVLSASPVPVTVTATHHSPTHFQGLGILPVSPVLVVRRGSDFVDALKPGFYCPTSVRATVWKFVKYATDNRVGMLGQSHTRR